MFFFLQEEGGIRYLTVTGVQRCALPIWGRCTSHSSFSTASCNAHPEAASRRCSRTDTLGTRRRASRVRRPCSSVIVIPRRVAPRDDRGSNAYLGLRLPSPARTNRTATTRAAG